ncbi:MAG: hypothetical protein AAFY11_16425, partial [Cyanobacteria bacterium J06641_5]
LMPLSVRPTTTLVVVTSPPAALDIGMTRQLQGPLQTVAAALIIASHDCNWVQEFCTHAAYLEAGKLQWQQAIAAVDWDSVQSRLATVAEEWD